MKATDCNPKDMINELAKYAEENGATAVKTLKTITAENEGSIRVITIKKIVVAPWVSQKCQFGCPEFGKHFNCPPFTPTHAETNLILPCYQNVVLFEFANLSSREGQEQARQVMLELEKRAFLAGNYKAFSYAGGPCRLCEKCVAAEIEHATIADTRLCRHPEKLRPSMESCGIDVYATVRAADLEIEVIKSRDQHFKSFALLMF